MKKFLIVLAAAAIAFAACSSTPEETAQTPPPQYVEQTDTYVVLDHKTKALGQDVPEWVTRFISEGVTGVESMPAYKDKYVFIGEDMGSNLNALRQWATGFTVNQEMSRMVSTRVQGKFAGAAVGSPDDEYGRYFENVVKSVTEASFSGARKESDFWLLKRYFKADGKSVDREEYEIYILTTIDKALLERQLDAVLEKAESDSSPTTEQKTAIDRVKEAFYEGF
ncbi:hypothetical protein LJC14_02005 [Treponema sp. OttesenSCG-928-L16]|nr:hypothetical protein [Treponema sp. OttesenSCG-928-L16]